MSDSLENCEQRDALLHASDLHFWEIVKNPFRLLNKRFLGNLNVLLRRRLIYRTELAESFSAAFLATGIKSILLGGDLSSTATDREFGQALRFAESLRARGVQVIVIPGNHDVYTFEAVRARRFERYFGDFPPHGPLPCRMQLPEGTPLVLAPTVCPNLISSRGRILPREIERVAGLVADAPAGPVLVAAHYPLLRETWAYKSSSGRVLRNADALRHALGQTNRRILFVAGHVHRFSHVRDHDYPMLSHLTTGALFTRPRGGRARGGFSEIRVQAGGFEVHVQRYDGAWTREILSLE